MSLLDELTGEIDAASGYLPLPALRRAVHDVRQANAHLVRAAQYGAPLRPSLARLGTSATHLENGAGLLMRAQDSLRDYIAAIGGRAATPVTGTVATPLDGSWWARRVAELTTETAPGCDDPARSGADLLVRVGRTVGANDRVGLHRQLAGAGAGLGSSLAGTATSTLLRLAAELLGRVPAGGDIAALRDRARVADLLPGLSFAVVETLLGQVCHGAAGRHDGPTHDGPLNPTAGRQHGPTYDGLHDAGTVRRHEPAGTGPAGHHDPVDIAVGAAVLAARFAQALGRSPEQLVHA